MGSNRFSAWGDLLIMAGMLCAATLVSVVCTTIVLLAAPALGQGPVMFISYGVQFTLTIAGTAVWFRLREGAALRLRFSASWFDGPMILGGIVLVTATSIVLEPLLTLFPEHYLERLNEMIGRGGWAVLITVVVAPLLEEIFFRGIVLERLSRRWSAAAAVVSSAAFFGLVHLPILPQMVNAFVIAIVMGYIYLATRSLIPVIIIHALNNGIAYMLLELTGTQSTDTRALIGNDTVYWTVYAASAAILVASIVFMARRAGTKTGENTLNEKTADGK